jgi:hypothetical protein
MKPTLPTLLILGGCAAAALSLSSCGPSGGEKKEGAAATPSAGSPATTTSTNPAAAPANVPAGDLVDITPEYPKPLFVGTPPPAVKIDNLEKADPENAKKMETFKVPKGTTNVAKGKKVTSSDPLPIIGSLDLVTDGDADGADGCYVELAPGIQWVQIDLEKEYNIWKILLWHFHKQSVVFFNVVVQVSDDPQFKDKSKITTIFNNDIEDKNKLGKGNDKNYVETNHGRLIDAKGVKGRYVRLYSNGNSADEMNRYIEVQVYGTEAK